MSKQDVTITGYKEGKFYYSSIGVDTTETTLGFTIRHWKGVVEPLGRLADLDVKFGNFKKLANLAVDGADMMFARRGEKREMDLSQNGSLSYVSIADIITAYDNHGSLSLRFPEGSKLKNLVLYNVPINYPSLESELPNLQNLRSLTLVNMLDEAPHSLLNGLPDSLRTLTIHCKDLYRFDVTELPAGLKKLVILDMQKPSEKDLLGYQALLARGTSIEFPSAGVTLSPKLTGNGDMSSVSKVFEAQRALATA